MAKLNRQELIESFLMEAESRINEGLTPIGVIYTNHEGVVSIGFNPIIGDDDVSTIFNEMCEVQKIKNKTKGQNPELN